jgi:hypothetical protein
MSEDESIRRHLIERSFCDVSMMNFTKINSLIKGSGNSLLPSLQTVLKINIVQDNQREKKAINHFSISFLFPV